MWKGIGAACVAMAIAGSAQAQQGTWSWHKAVRSGGSVEVRGVVGDISATPASGGEVEVVARITRDGRPASDVKIMAVEDAEGVVICAVYPDSQDDDTPCERGGSRGHSTGNHRNSSNNEPSEVDFEVRIPRGIAFTGSSVTGDVTATGMTAFTSGSSVTGDVEIQTSDLARASSVSGSVNVSMGRSDWSNEIAFSSVSGNVTLEMPGNLDAELRASTVSGEIESDWPVTINSRIASRTVRGTIGRGGRTLALSTVSGDISLRRRN